MAVFNFQTQQLEFALKDPFAFRTSTEAGNAVRRSIIDPQYNNWADRVGLVYRLTKITVIRAGHGWYWNNVNNNQLTQSMSLFYPFVYNPQQNRIELTTDARRSSTATCIPAGRREPICLPARRSRSSRSRRISSGRTPANGTSISSKALLPIW